jgi:hypothetical protein
MGEIGNATSGELAIVGTGLRPADIPLILISISFCHRRIFQCFSCTHSSIAIPEHELRRIIVIVWITFRTTSVRQLMLASFFSISNSEPAFIANIDAWRDVLALRNSTWFHAPDGLS